MATAAFSAGEHEKLLQSFSSEGVAPTIPLVLAALAAVLVSVAKVVGVAELGFAEPEPEAEVTPLVCAD